MKKKIFDINNKKQKESIPLVLFFMDELSRNKNTTIKFVYSKELATSSYPIFPFYKPISTLI